MEFWQVLGAALVIASIIALQLGGRQAEKG